MALVVAFAATLAAASSAGAHDCQCRFDGRKYDQGATVCMRGKIARCGMYLNNASWNVVADLCPQVRTPQSPQLATTLAGPQRATLAGPQRATLAGPQRATLAGMAQRR